MNTNAATIRELMTQWTKARTAWVAFHGTDAGFSEWFTKQVGL
jgi:hypothetical protein